MSVSIVLDPGCEATVQARMSNRPGCTASGADSGDRLRVRNAMGTATWQTGASNATIFDSHTQLGGTVVIEGNSNRADEIITYEVFYSSGFCPFCIMLPVEWLTFNAHTSGDEVLLNWSVIEDPMNVGYKVQISPDQQYFQTVGFVPPKGGGNGVSTAYHHWMTLPGFGEYYIRILQEDLNGDHSYSPVLFVEQKSTEIKILSRRNESIIQVFHDREEACVISLFNSEGKRMDEFFFFSDNEKQIELKLDKGVYFLLFTTESGVTQKERFIVIE